MILADKITDLRKKNGWSQEELAHQLGMDVLLALVAAGVYQLVLTDGIYESFQKLLEEGDYTRKKKQDSKRNEPLAQIYWCVVLAVYLGWSFVTMDWERTWIIWPVAAVLYGAVLGISAIVRKGR